jgi:hypothetical protein
VAESSSLADGGAPGDDGARRTARGRSHVRRTVGGNPCDRVLALISSPDCSLNGSVAGVSGLAQTNSRSYALSLLTAVCFFNYLDRMIIAILLEPIKRELGLSDAQMGLVAGFAFAML